MNLSDLFNEGTVQLIISVSIFLLFSYIVYYTVSVYLLLKKAKYRNTWAAFVPIYQQWAVNEIAGKPGWWTLVGLGSLISWLYPDSLLLQSLGNLISITALILQIIVDINLAKVFGRSLKFALALIFFPFPMYLVLALSESKYIKPKKTKSNKK